jgi:hypothetical protein
MVKVINTLGIALSVIRRYGTFTIATLALVLSIFNTYCSNHKSYSLNVSCDPRTNADDLSFDVCIANCGTTDFIVTEVGVGLLSSQNRIRYIKSLKKDVPYLIKPNEVWFATVIPSQNDLHEWMPEPDKDVAPYFFGIDGKGARFRWNDTHITPVIANGHVKTIDETPPRRVN